MTETTLTILFYTKPHIVLALDHFTVYLPEDGPNGPKHVGVLKYIINIRKVHLLEVVVHILMKMHGKHSIKICSSYLLIVLLSDTV
jgi:hypothetical protein